MGGSDGEHRCEWRERAERREAELAQANGQLAEMGEKVAGMAATLEKLQRHLFGKRSEKIPPVADQLRQAGVPADPAIALERRRESAAKRKELATSRIEHKVPE